MIAALLAGFILVASVGLLALIAFALWVHPYAGEPWCRACGRQMVVCTCRCALHDDCGGYKVDCPAWRYDHHTERWRLCEPILRGHP